MPLIRKDGASKALAPAATDLTSRLRSGSADERFAAARSLAGLDEATPVLSAALASEADPRVREAILTALAKSGGESSVVAIFPLIRSDDASVRTGALDALRLMPDAVASHLPAILRDADSDVRLLACELARQLPGPVGSKIICDLLASEREPNVCAAALDVLVEVGGPEALPVLTDCALRFADEPFLQFAIRVAKDRLTSSPAQPSG